MKSVYLVLPVCEFLNRCRFDALAVAAISSLRPSGVRVVSPGDIATDDARLWRVTVYVNGADEIERIEQEVEAQLDDQSPLKHGADLKNSLRLKCSSLGKY
jgi:hypothetical protein